MLASATAWWAPKAGNAAQEYEDAYALEEAALRYAVADGASETSFAKQWAEMLVDRFVREPPAPESLREWVAPMQAAWAGANKPKATAWYAEEKARDGAFSSLLGVAIDHGRWRAMAIGDSCLFLVRSGKLVRAFPLERAAAFNNRPLLLSSVARANQRVWEEVRLDEGELQGKDLLLLMTDALAQWFLVEAELGRRPWAALARAATQEAFCAFVDMLRSGGALRNDDTTLVRVEVAA
jgi:serine/threonine protein phosphatase PrpC